jgi:hypothetical protein
LIQIFYPAPSSRIPTFYVLRLMQETKFQLLMKYQISCKFFKILFTYKVTTYYPCKLNRGSSVKRPEYLQFTYFVCEATNKPALREYYYHVPRLLLELQYSNCWTCSQLSTSNRWKPKHVVGTSEIEMVYCCADWTCAELYKKGKFE